MFLKLPADILMLFATHLLEELRMKDYEFRLTPGYCLYNGIAVMSQQGSSICFITENPGDEFLKERIKKAFNNYLEYIVNFLLFLNLFVK